MLEALKVFDKNNNGLISAIELRYVLTLLEEKPLDEEVDELIKEAEPDLNGNIKYVEFAKKLMKRPEK